MTTTRVWLATQNFVPIRGGGARRLYGYLPGLRERGAEVSVLSGTHKASKILRSDRDSDWYPLAPGTPLPKTRLPNGTPLWGIRLPEKHGAKKQAAYYRWLIGEFEQAAEKPDLLAFALVLNSKTESWLRRACRLDVPTVYLFTLTNKLPENPLLRSTKRRSLARQYGSFDCVIVSSADHEKWLRDLGVNTRVEVIPNGVDSARFRPARNSEERNVLRTKLGFQPDQKIVLNLGAVTPRKGTDLAIQAWARLARGRPEYHLVVLGQRSEQPDSAMASFHGRIEGLLADPQIRDRVHMRGVVDDVEVYYRMADALLFPTEREGMPNAMLEAMASGLPVVLSPFIGLAAELGRADEHYLLADRNPQSLADALQDALTASVGGPIATRAREWMVERMAIASSLDRYAEVFHDLAHPKS